MSEDFRQSMEEESQQCHANNLPSGLERATSGTSKTLPRISPGPPIRPPPSLKDIERQAGDQMIPIPPWPIVRHVTGTRKIVTAYLQGQAINRESIGWTIRRAQYGVEEVIHSIGDGQLPAKIDPFTEDFSYGCYVSVWSNRVPGAQSQLTWGDLNSTLEGLLNIAYVQGYAYEMKFSVSDVGRGMVSRGYIKAGSIHRAGLRDGKSRADETVKAGYS
ncbi:MAG: hypothetical protein LQ337_002217 [Flavoplaca oasis]|nr:MAG: hypothetical protein LQ337_002217 [Flavoplaca oasis]